MEERGLPRAPHLTIYQSETKRVQGWDDHLITQGKNAQMNTIHTTRLHGELWGSLHNSLLNLSMLTVLTHVLDFKRNDMFAYSS